MREQAWSSECFCVHHSVQELRFRQSVVEVGSNRVERLVESSGRWLQMHRKDLSAHPSCARSDDFRQQA